ncbi:nucleotidyl transferase AbiEii/AbiGii toxin family protein [Cellulomonas sp. Marseille-Q8402]
MTVAEELGAVAERFGADQVQVERDHLISHVLAALASVPTDDLVFFGGTALSRTLLPHGRLSEDIDLIARGSRAAVADSVTDTVDRALRRTHGRPRWEPALADVTGPGTSVLSVPSGASIRVQLLAGDGYAWPTEVTPIEQRYSDVPPTLLRTLTAPAFAAAKLAAWIDRRASRDLWDLAQLAEVGLVDGRAAEVFRRFGPFGSAPGGWVFAPPPSEPVWQRDLAHQTVLTIDPQTAAAVVRAAWERAFAQ